MTDLADLQRILKEMRKENKRLRSERKHFIARDGLRHLNNYTIRTIESSYYQDKKGRYRCQDCKRFVIEPRHTTLL